MIVYLLAIGLSHASDSCFDVLLRWAGQSERAVQSDAVGRTKQGDHDTNGNTYYGIKLDIGEATGSTSSSPVLVWLRPSIQKGLAYDYFRKPQHRANQPCVCCREPRR